MTTKKTGLPGWLLPILALLLPACGGGGGDGGDPGNPPPPADVTPPIVLWTTPADGAIGVAVTSTVQIRFSEAMDPATLIASTITLRDGATTVAGSISQPANHTALFTPSSSLAAGHSFTIGVTMDCRDLAGNSLALPYSSGFSTMGDPVQIERVSVSSSGAQGSSGSVWAPTPAISADGRYVAFDSVHSNLVSGDTNGNTDVFVRDRQANTTTRVSVNSAGAQSNGNSYAPSLSADGRYVAFLSSADNLVADDTNLQDDIFVHDRATGLTVRVSLTAAGFQVYSRNFMAPSLAPGGGFIVFATDAALVPADTNDSYDIYVRNLADGTLTRESVSSAGVQGNNNCTRATLSADGRYVAFDSVANNLVAGDTNFYRDVFLRDRQLGTTTRLSTGVGGVPGNGASEAPEISANGLYVGFYSSADNLVAGDTNNAVDIFVADLAAGTLSRASVDSAGLQGNGDSNRYSFGSYRFGGLSADGRYVAFHSRATNLVTGDTNGRWDVFVHDRVGGATERISLGSTGAQGDSDDFYPPAISGDGRFVAFTSWSSNLVSGDTNGQLDVFVRGPLR